MEKKNVYFVDRITFPQDMVFTPPDVECNFQTFDYLEPDEIVENCFDAHVIITNKASIPQAVFEELPNLELVSIAATGYDHVDLITARQSNITITNIKDYGNDEIAEHVWAMILALRKQLPAYRKSINAGAWDKSQAFCLFDHPIESLINKKLGIIGSGSLGSAVGHIGEAFGMDVLYSLRKNSNEPACERNGKNLVPFRKIITESDVISVHCPLREDTVDLIAGPEFGLMKRNCILINAARGGIVNENALVKAINEKQIAGAGLDVLTSEPPAHDNPIRALFDHPHVVVTPHIAWTSKETLNNVWQMTMENIVNFYSGGEISEVE